MDPIATIIEFTGRPAVLVLASQAPKYDPRVSTPFVPGAPIELPMIAQFQKTVQAGEPADVVAQLMFTTAPFSAPNTGYAFAYDYQAQVTKIFDGAVLIGEVLPDRTRVQIQGLDFVVKTCRPRYWMQEVNGFTLGLAN